jgi:hypothetical protein
MLGKGVFMAKNDATVPVTFVKNAAETGKCICLFKQRYSFVVSVASAKDYIEMVLIPVSGKGNCYPCAAIIQ